jgi:hypothetical protein
VEAIHLLGSQETQADKIEPGLRWVREDEGMGSCGREL